MQCEYSDATGHCRKKATRRTDARALGKAEDGLDLCAEHHQVVKAWWLRQGEQAGPPSTEPCEGC